MRDRAIEVRVIEQDLGTLSAQFERHALEAFRCIAQDLSTGHGGAGEGDLGDVGMPAEFRSDHVAVAVDDIENAIGQSCFV